MFEWRHCRRLQLPLRCPARLAAASALCLQLRARVWPVLLAVEAPLAREAATFAARAAAGHKDSHVVACDMERSLWSFTEGARLLLLWCC